MTKISEACFEATGHTSIICDFSPPRAGDPQMAQQADLEADFILVAYNPGRAVRVNSAMLAAAIKGWEGREAGFTVATRDMNKLAMQSQLLGAQLLGLENVVVVAGDPFPEQDLTRVKPVADFRPTELIRAIHRMNQGLDFREARLRSPTEFCVGATLDLGRDLRRETRLAHRKAQAGAQFFVAQPIFDVAEAGRFRDVYRSDTGQALDTPVFFGLQVLEAGGVLFSSVPDRVREELSAGRSGVEIAVELFQRFREAGLHNVYLIPPIRRGGARDYDAAREVLAEVSRV